MGWFVSSDLRWGVVGWWPCSLCGATLHLAPSSWWVRDVSAPRAAGGGICPLKPPFGELLICGKWQLSRSPPLVQTPGDNRVFPYFSKLSSLQPVLCSPQEIPDKSSGEGSKGKHACCRTANLWQEAWICRAGRNIVFHCSQRPGQHCPRVQDGESWSTFGVSEGLCVSTCVSCVTSSGN